MFQTNLHMIHHWKGLELEIAEFEYKHDRTPSAESIPTQPHRLQYVENIKIQNITMFETSLEGS